METILAFVTTYPVPVLGALALALIAAVTAANS